MGKGMYNEIMNDGRKKILILTLSAGGGHNSAAGAVKDALEQKGFSCEIKNSLDFTSSVKKFIVTNGHVLMYRHLPKLYALGYKIQDSLSSEDLYADYRRFAKQASAFVLAGGFHAVICVHIFPAIMLTEAKKKFSFHVPVFFISTDYTSSPGADRTRADRYFVPEGCGKEFLARSKTDLSSDRIEETGIPVNAVFYQHLPKEEARQRLSGICSEFSGTRAEDPVVLIGAGSMGCGPLKEIAIRLASEQPGIRVVVFCGKNGKLKGRLDQAGKDLPNLIPLGFTKEVPLWMRAADLMITKPGGLTTTEAAVSGLPLLLFDEVPGLETHNMAWLVRRGCAMKAKNIPGIIRTAVMLVNTKKYLAGITARQKKHFSKNSAERIAGSISSFLNH